MEILVTGIGEEKFAPDWIRIYVTFQIREASYQDAFDHGVEAVDSFIRKVLPKAGLKKKDFISTYLNVSVENRYDEETRQMVKSGYLFNQSGHISFAYDMKKAAAVFEAMSLLERGPDYNLQFSLKEDREARDRTIEKAYADAREKAEAIARSAGLTLGKCRKADLNHTGMHITSNTVYDMATEEMAYANGNLRAAKSSVANIFTPEDISIQQTLYCVFEAD